MAVAVSVSSESMATEVVKDVMVDVSGPVVTQRDRGDTWEIYHEDSSLFMLHYALPL